MLNRLALLLLVTALPVQAVPPPDLEPLPELPPPAVETPPAPTGLADEDLEPEVKIIKRDDAVIHEYRSGGRLYMVKVIPTRGYPYYLYDADGNGSLESRQDRLEPVIPRWVIHSW
ncbi:MAG: DUF2782 domain-containing protein [Gammaproteobacteria bacterium]|nr:DUF2782 domain-containing protein [Gammaproteobacteria bacterium]